MHHRSAARSLALCLVLLGGLARAEHDPFIRSFDSVPTKATPSAQSGIALEGAEMPEAQSLHAALLLDLNLGVLALKLGNEKLGDLIPARLDAHLHFAYQVIQRLELSADLPVTLWQADNVQILRDQGFPQPGIAAVGLNDMRLLGKVSIFKPADFPVGLAAVAELRFPTGVEQSFLGDRSVVFAPRGIIERSFGPFRVLANVGLRIRSHAQFLNLYVGNELTAGVGTMLRLPDMGQINQVYAMGEMHVATPLATPFTFSSADSLKTPWELLLGIRGRVANRISAELDLGRGLGLTTGYGRETFRIIAKVAYDFQPGDRDNDGISDADDVCPDQPEDKDGFEDSDGCPDPDNDRDGVLDKEDACPNDPGPRELDGCPDRDGDEIPDNVDKCPDEFGPAENEGCPTEPPRVLVEASRIRIKNNINFETGEARIKPESFPILDELLDVLRKNPKVGPVQVEGHTDNVGSRPYNLDLSDRRANAVVDYLVKRGIDKSRLRWKGYGFDRPVAPNTTALGRAKNRRVDFTLIEPEKGAAPAEAPPPAPAPAKP